MSSIYSSFICESCNSKLSEFSDFQNELIENQTRLYNTRFEESEHYEGEQQIEETIAEEQVKPEDVNSQKLIVVRVSSLIDETTIEKEWHCTICESSFPSIKQLRFHRKVHKTSAREDRVMCPHCGLTFSRNGWYHHVRRVFKSS